MRPERGEPGGPQLLRAIVSMTCSSLHLSLCLLACSSRSSADKIWRRKEERSVDVTNFLSTLVMFLVNMEHQWTARYQGLLRSGLVSLRVEGVSVLWTS